MPTRSLLLTPSILVCLFLAQPGQEAFAQSTDHAPSAEKGYVVFYFGATSCAACNRPEVIQAVRSIKSGFEHVHTRFPAKFVMVSMDEDIEEGIEFLEKYGYWDEVSVGSFYRNELVMRHVNTLEIPGLPQVMVYENTYEDAEHGTKTVKETERVAQVMGGEGIVAWAEKDFPLETK